MTLRPLHALVLLPLLVAGCLSDAALAPAPGAASPAEAEAAAADVLLDLEGRTGAAGFVCASVPAFTTCEGGFVPVGDAKTWFPQTLNGPLVAADLVLSWEPGPGTEELLLGLAIERGGEIEFVVESGPSPVALRRSGLDVPADAQVSLYVWTPCTGAQVVAVCTTTPTDFRVTGTLTVAAPAAGASSA